MTEERVQRRLAAILAADIVGFSRLMEADEEGTLARLKTLRADVIDPKVAEYGGRVFKSTGDGVLAEFSSAVDAVRHAIDVQRAMAELNADTPDDSRIAFRIGISLGDVVIDGEDLLGNGVNMAARMEGLADAGGICVSGNVQEHIGNSLDVMFEDMGEQSVKNIARPVRCYRVRRPVDQAARIRQSESADKPSIAVLPFNNISGDPEQEYFADGISEDIITALSRIREFSVIARNSTFTYKGRSVDVQTIAKELAARYVLEGSVRKAGSRVRVTAQLIEGTTGNHLWAERYDRDLVDIFAVQDEITHTVVGTIGPELGRAEQQRANSKPPDNLGAWDCYQRGKWHLHRRTNEQMKEDLAKARSLFERAMTLDPGFGPAYAGYAETIYYDALFQYREYDAAQAMRSARKAVELDSEDANARVTLGRIYRMARNPEAAVSENKMAIELNPSLAEAYHGLGSSLAHSGRAREAVPYLETAIRLSPRDDLIGTFHVRLALAHLLLENHDQAVEIGQRAVRLRGTMANGYAYLAAALGHLGRIEDAEEILKELEAAEPRASISYYTGQLPILDADDTAHVIDGLRKAGLRE